MESFPEADCVRVPDEGRGSTRPVKVMDGPSMRLAALCAAAGLVLDQPALSARRTAGAQVAAVLALVAAAGLVLACATPSGRQLAAGAAALLLVLGLVRLLVALAGLTNRPAAAHTGAAIPHDLPRYSVLIALHREASVVPDLVGALSRLDWPADRIEFVFVVEQADAATREALEHHARPLAPWILVLPPLGPTTKPKALQAALPFLTGDIVAVFDAEDHPAPDQLRAAWQAFRTGGPQLAVVQAPLVTWNDRESWIASQFTLDYAIWFRLIMPGLARFGHFLPLGGTSNHFRVAPLRAAGGWDPFNVTEDADLALRLARLGWRIGLVSPPTFEEAPPSLPIWMRQRSRWIQGHIITACVHLRRPASLVKALGSGGGLIAFAAMMIGPLVAILRVPLMLAMLVAAVAGEFSWVTMLLGLAGLAIEAVLSVLAIARDGRWRLLAQVPTGPVYHLLQGIAAAMAVQSVLLAPHHWRKTCHGREARPCKGQ